MTDRGVLNPTFKFLCTILLPENVLSEGEVAVVESEIKLRFFSSSGLSHSRVHRRRQGAGRTQDCCVWDKCQQNITVTSI